MNIAIVGAGIVGITTAWELARDGHAVTVFDRRSAAAEAASFANAGMLMPADLLPWTSPGLRRTLVPSLFAAPDAIDLRWPLPGRERVWARQWRRASRSTAEQARRTRLQQLARYSQARLHALVAERELVYERSEGGLMLLRGKAEHRRVQPALQSLREAGAALREIDADEARRLEPALSRDTDLLAAIHLPEGETGNCRQFALLLKREAEALGAQFFLDCDIAPLSAAAPLALRLASGSEPVHYDAIVVCAGAEAATLLQPLGLRLPLAAVHGYSISATLREPLNAPRSAVIDARFKTTISRLGQRVRVAGGAELGGEPGALNPDALQVLYKVLHDWFPGSAQLDSGVQRWKGAYPLLPDGLPLIGASGVPGVWLNLGHGASGWALCCASARILADGVAGRAPEVDTNGLGLERLH